MILLEGHSLTKRRRVPVVSLGLVLRERDTAATLVPGSMGGITTESWMQDDTEPGKGIVYRIRSIQTAFTTDTQTIQLEHVIRTLSDTLLVGEHTPQMMGGGDTCTAKQAAEYVLKKSADWTLGKFDYANVRNAYTFNGDNLLDALEEISRTLEDCRWSYDFGSYPFRLNITRKNTSNPCELRPGRNLAAITKTVDRSGMYTRFYPIGKNDLRLPGNGYVQKNTGKYGVIEKNEVDATRTTEAELRAWAEERLRTHAEPRVEIQAEGFDLAKATGEDLDRLTLGRGCRIPLEEFDTIIEEEIVEMNYRDKANEPENVRITLANEQEDVLRILAREIKEGSGPSGSGRGGGGRGGAKQAKEDNAWFEDTNEHVAMCARGIIGVDDKGEVNWERLSRLEVNENGIFGEVKTVQGDQELMSSRLEMVEGTFKATVKAIGKDGEITAASICLAIEKAGSKATIKADHITLGTNKLSSILTIIGSAVGITKPLVCSSDLTINSKGKLSCYNITLAGTDGITLNAAAMRNAIKKAEIVENGKKLKLTPFVGDPITFEKAVDLTGSWASGVFTARAGDMSLATSLAPAPGQATWDGDVVSIPIYATIGSSGVLHDTGKTATATKPADTITYGSLNEGNSNPGSAAKTYDLDTRYKFHYFNVTVNGSAKRIVMRTG